MPPCITENNTKTQIKVIMLMFLVILYLSTRIFLIDSCTIPAVINGSVGYYARVSQHQTFYQFVEFQVGKSFEEGESVFLLCNDGFIPQGSSSTAGGGIGPPETVFCENGTWSKPMFCKPVSCFGKPPPIDNGYPVVYNRSHGHVVLYVCNKHYFKVENGRVVCHYGTWKGQVPTCVDGRCYTRELNYPGLAKTQGEYANHLGYIRVACTQGYTVYRNGTKIQCIKGVWYVPQKLCVKEPDPPIDIETPKNSCMCSVYHQDSNLQAVVNGHKQHALELKWKMGDTAHLSCADSSMNLVWSNGTYASPSLTCDECRIWDVNDIPSCQICHKDPEIRCSRFSAEDTDLLSVDYEDEDVRAGSRATFSCRNDGQILSGMSTTVCLRSGEWTSPPPQCIKPQVQCPPVDENDSFAVCYSSSRGEGSTATLYCRDAHHIIRGTRIRTCLPTGEWSDANPTCEAITCEVPLTPIHGSVLLRDGPKVGMTAVYSCDDGRTLVGSSASECLITGEWTLPQPECLKKCSTEPPKIPNGRFNNTSRDHNSEVKYECEPGYNMSGRPAVKCLDGEWSGQPPDCVREKCSSEPPEILYGSFHYTSPNSEVEYECDPGYTLSPSSSVKCLNGEWSGKPPVCVEKKCSSDPPKVQYGRFYYTRRDPIAQIEYDCNRGYNMAGNSTVKCVSGEWRGQPPVCVKVEPGCICSVDDSTPGFAYRFVVESHVPKGARYRLNCVYSSYPEVILWPNGMRTESSGFFCDGCRKWKLTAFPTCVPSNKGEAIIDGNILEFEHTGALKPPRGEKLEIRCYTTIKEYPRWDYSHTKEQFQVINNISWLNMHVFRNSYLVIPEFGPQHVGIYECSTSRTNIPPTKFELRLKGT